MSPQRLLSAWRRLGGNPFGRFLFNAAISISVPYSGSVRPKVVELSPGSTHVKLHDRRRVRNHLKSIHAIAMANVLELASGLAMMAALSDDVRGIVTSLEVTYHKKGRGTLDIRSQCTPPTEVSERTSFLAHAEARDSSGELVSSIAVTWLLGPAKKT